MDIKNEAAKGFFYKFCERILAQLVSIIVSVVLARILLPEEYGLVAIVTIIITICNVFVTDGFGSSLIQKKNADQKDFSTIFWAGFFLSIVLYFIIYFSATWIADYYNNPLLIGLIRVMGVRIPISAINSVQHAYISKHFLFKKFFYATLVGTVLSGIIGIAFAYKGFGVWALVIQYLLNVSVDTVMLLLIVDFFPSLFFSFKRFFELLSFGFKVLLSGLIGTIYDEIRSIAIAGVYSSADLSFYTKGKQFPQLLGNNLSVTISSVLFPVFSFIQTKPMQLKYSVRKAMRVSTYIMTPLLVLFAAISNNFVSVVFTEKWMPCVPYIKIFCLLYLLKAVKNINKSAIKAIGRSDIDLYINIVEKAVGILLIILTLRISPYYIALSAFLSYLLSAILEQCATRHYLSYSFREQITDIFFPFLVSIILYCIIILFDFIRINPFFLMVVQSLAFMLLYLSISFVCKNREFYSLWRFVKKYISQ